MAGYTQWVMVLVAVPLALTVGIVAGTVVEAVVKRRCPDVDRDTVTNVGVLTWLAVTVSAGVAAVWVILS